MEHPSAPSPAARQARPEVTLAVRRGACRLMRQAGRAVLLELPLPDGRRADIFAIGRDGELTIVEVKSSIEDWRVDAKWPDYLDWCDQLYVAVPVDFPQALIPAEIGLIVADAYGGEIMRQPPRRPVAAARRKALLIDGARLASERLARLDDPDFGDIVA
ncbi:MAG: MmcB family DNA repair protein [Reyranella sp.]|nr:MmcB family DNA repair protein [Reyranella sp.]